MSGIQCVSVINGLNEEIGYAIIVKKRESEKEVSSIRRAAADPYLFAVERNDRVSSQFAVFISHLQVTDDGVHLRPRCENSTWYKSRPLVHSKEKNFARVRPLAYADKESQGLSRTSLALRLAKYSGSDVLMSVSSLGNI